VESYVGGAGGQATPVVRMKYFINCDWGLALLHGYKTGDYSALLEQKRAVESRGFTFGQRIYVDAPHGVGAGGVFFWRGHRWLDGGTTSPTIRELLNKSRELGIGVVPVLSTFHPGYPPDYNEIRHRVDQGRLNSIWQEIIDVWGDNIIACQIDNEPLSGGGGYTLEEYRTRAAKESVFLNGKGYQVIATNIDSAGIWTDHHLAIGRDVFDFPPLASTESLSENWLRPNVPGQRYADFTEYCKAHLRLRLAAVNFGAPFIPQEGLRWGNSRYRTFLMDSTSNSWNETGKAVMASLGEVEDEVSKEQLQKLIDRWEARSDRLATRLANPASNKPRLRGRVDENARCQMDLEELMNA